jgi:hypothetical protein
VPASEGRLVRAALRQLTTHGRVVVVLGIPSVLDVTNDPRG